jgi:hypothetical protein
MACHPWAVTEDEAKAVAAVAALCLTWSGWRRWEPVMRYGRLFTPGTDAVSDGRRMTQPQDAGRAAYRMAADSGLLYAEGYATYLRRGGVPPTPWAWAWCLDGETVVAPPTIIEGTAFFGVALRPQYLHRVHAAQRGDDGREGFWWAFTRGDRETPTLDPATDIALDLGRDIPASVREWALTAERHPGPARRPPDWVVTELLGPGPHPVAEDPYRVMKELLGARPAAHDPLYGLFVPTPSQQQVPGTAPSGPYSRYMVRSADWFTSGMALQCGGKTGGVFSDDGEIVGMIQDGDSVATLMRMADEHRPQCEWETPVAGKEAGQAAWTPAQASLQSAGRTFAVLRRLDYNVWDAWLCPAAPDGQAGVRVTRNGVSYEMAFAAVFRAMGAAMPADFATVYAGEQPDPTPYPAPFVPTPELWAQPESRLPMSYERDLIRSTYGVPGMCLHDSGQTGGINSRDGVRLAAVGDGTSLAALIQSADERRSVSEWTTCPEGERMNPELTVQKNAEVDLCWGMGGEAYFAALHRFADGTWDAWLTPSHVPVTGREEPTDLLTPAGVSYEMALAAIFRTMGEDMPTGFGLNYLNVRITPGLPGPAQA